MLDPLHYEDCFFEYFPKIDMGNVTLRAIEVGDAHSFFRYMQNPISNKFIFDNDIPRTVDQAERELRYWSNLFHNRNGIYWAVTDPNNNQMIGSCGFHNWSGNNRRIEVGYELDMNYWHKGLMTKCISAICLLAFELVKVHRIQALIACDNKSSIRLAERLGFVREGKLRKYAMLRGKSHDFFIYARNDVKDLPLYDFTYDE
jgi:ribosomal-protein-alanine N-acetyltransferase